MKKKQKNNCYRRINNMAAIDKDGRDELQNRIKNPLEHLYDKLSKLQITLNKDHKKGSTITVDAFSMAGGGDVFGSIYEFLEEMNGWATPGSPKAPSVTVDGKVFREKV